MNILSNRKKFVESRYAPKDTNVLWVSKSEKEIKDIKQFINGQWTSILSKSPGEGEEGNPIINNIVETYGGKGSNFQIVFVDSNTDTITKVQAINESNNVWYQSKSENIKTYQCPYNIVYNVGDKWSSGELSTQTGEYRLVHIGQKAEEVLLRCTKQTIRPVLQSAPIEDLIEETKYIYTDITKGTTIEVIAIE